MNRIIYLLIIGILILFLTIGCGLFPIDEALYQEIHGNDDGQEQPNKYTLTVIINPAGTSSVVKTPDHTEYEKGTVVELTANPNSGYLFDHWEGDVTGNDNPVTLIMDATRDETAVFVEDPFTNELEIDDFQDYTNNGPPGG